MEKALQPLVLAYPYGSAKYLASSLFSDFQKKAEALKGLEEEARKSNLSQEDLDKLLKE
jgi:hypothetical protein